MSTVKTTRILAASRVVHGKRANRKSEVLLHISGNATPQQMTAAS